MARGKDMNEVVLICPHCAAVLRVKVENGCPEIDTRVCLYCDVAMQMVEVSSTFRGLVESHF